MAPQNPVEKAIGDEVDHARHYGGIATHRVAAKPSTPLPPRGRRTSRVSAARLDIDETAEGAIDAHPSGALLSFGKGRWSH